MDKEFKEKYGTNIYTSGPKKFGFIPTLEPKLESDLQLSGFSGDENSIRTAIETRNKKEEIHPKMPYNNEFLEGFNSLEKMNDPRYEPFDASHDRSRFAIERNRKKELLPYDPDKVIEGFDSLQ